MEYSVEHLLNAVKEYPLIFNKRHPEFKAREKKDMAWEEIGKLFGLSGIQVEKKFKNLKDIYMRKKQLIQEKQKSGAGAADIPTIKWPHFEAMVELMEDAPQPELILCSADGDKSVTYRVEEGGENSMALQVFSEAPSHSDAEGEACGQEYIPEETEMAAPLAAAPEAPPAKRARVSQKKKEEILKMQERAAARK